uniref:Uncharacterized protein n=1 Tax=Salmonella sp. TaxID=599 RepID=A0A482EVN4_SALSP|nr:hypothetical protein NNIBIDOC_00173 [Salmonella sp.]
MNLSISKATRVALDIAELVGSRHGNALRTIRNMMVSGVIRETQNEFVERINNLGKVVKRSGLCLRRRARKTRQHCCRRAPSRIYRPVGGSLARTSRRMPGTVKIKKAELAEMAQCISLSMNAGSTLLMPV